MKRIFFCILLLLCYNLQIFANQQFINNFSRARNLYKNGRYYEAAELFEKLAKLSTKDEDKFKAFFNAGLSYRNAGNIAFDNKTEIYFKSFDMFVSALECSDTDNAPVFEKLSELLSSAFVVTVKNKDQFLKLIDFYQKNINNFADKIYIDNQIKLLENEISKIEFIKASRFAENREFDKAIETIEKIKETTPDFKNITWQTLNLYLEKYRFYFIAAGIFILLIFFIWLISVRLNISKKNKKLKFVEQNTIDENFAIDKQFLDKKIRGHNLIIKFLNLFRQFKKIDELIKKLQESHKTKIFGFCQKNKDNPALVVSFYEYLLSIGWDEAAQYFELADIYNSLKLTDSAIKTLLKINTDSLTRDQILLYYLKLAELFQRTGSIGLAIRQLENALRIAPDRLDIYMKIGDLSTILKNYKKSADIYLELLRYDKKYLSVIETKLELILQKCQTKIEKMLILEVFETIYNSIIIDYKKLVGIYNRMLELENDNYTILIKLGRLYLNLKAYSDAYRIFKKKKEIQADEKIYRILAIISKELNFKSEEQRYLYLLFENNNLNNDRLKLVRLIELLKQSNDLEKLANVYKKIIADNPENIEYIKSYINVLIMQKKYSELLPLLNRLVSLETQELNFAIERLDMIFDYYDDKIALYKTYIELYGTAGNSAKMEEYYNRLISEHKDAALIQEKIALATIYKETGRETEALKIYENILKFEPENIEILKQSANLYLNCNMMREAKEQFEKILKIQENNEYAQSKIEYLESIVKNSHIMKFQELLNDSMTTEAKKLEILYDLAKAYYDTGFYKLAIDELKKIIKLSNDKILWKRSLELITEIFVVSKQTGLGLQYLANILMKNTGNQREELILKYCVAKLYIAHDEKPKAKALFEEIAVIDDNFEDVQKQLFLLEDVKSSRNDLITLQYGYAMPRELKKSTLERYEIIQELGRGGMGIVYKARDKKLDRIVALKQLPANTDIHSEQAKRLFIEARAVAKLNHHNIVNVFDVGDSEDEMYISMEYVEGKTLTEIIKNEKYVFDEHYVKNIALQICAALDFAHRHNIIHRDIKPDNIMITIDNNIKIMDFGLAKQANENVSMTQEGIAMGTAQYMSPEQIRGEDIDNRTDIYAFGCVLFEMIAAAPPFDSKNINALIYKHLSAKPPNIRSIVATAPEQFELIINKCLEKDKNNRYSNAAEIIEDLKKI